MKIFVTGFQRSGTTILRDILDKHPQVERMFHEQGLLRFDKESLYSMSAINDSVLFTKGRKEKVVGDKTIEIDFSLERDNWGEKIPYYQLDIHKNEIDTDIFEYCRKWNSYFGDESKIIHILRHPVDIALSNKNSGYAPNFQIPFDLWFQNVPLVLEEFRSSFDNVLTVKYEDILFDPEKLLTQVFSFSNLDASSAALDEVLSSKKFYKFRKLNKSRAFTYKDLPNFDLERLLRTGYDFQKVLQQVNKIGEQEYTL